MKETIDSICIFFKTANEAGLLEGDGCKMTLQQLRYVTCVAKCASITEAAKELYITQPSLTKAIKELETEMGVTIFDRTNKGIHISKDGERFLSYARQVLEQAELLEETYKSPVRRKSEFCVSTQHYSFAVNAFVDLIQNCGSESYDFNIRETQTYEIIEDVARRKSELGILYFNDFNRTVLTKMLKANALTFYELFVAKPHIFVSTKHPLANRMSVAMEELTPYPYLSFEQGEHNSFYYSEEIFSTINRPKNIRVRDRATLFNLLIGLNGYTVCSGILDEALNGANIVAVPLAAEGDMHIGYILPDGAHLSRLGALYLEALKKYTIPSLP